MGKYDNNTVADDSSPGVELPEGALVLVWNEGGKNLCRCGCLEVRLGAGEFRQGHDARLKGKLNRAHVRQNTLLLIEDEERTWTTPYDYAETRNWGKFLEKAQITSQRQADQATVRRSKQTVGQQAAADRVNGASLDTMKAAARVLKAVGRYGAAAGEDRIEVTAANALAIAEGGYEGVTGRLTVDEATGLFIGETVGLERGGHMNKVQILEISGERARVETVKISGEQEEWVVELTSLWKGIR